MSDQVEIRPLNSTDVAEVVTLWNSTLIAHQITDNRFISLFFSDVNALSKLMHSSFVAVTDRIVGFVIAVKRNLPAPGLGLEPDVGYLSAIAVNPAWQRKGIGSKLLQHAVADLRVAQILVCGRTGSAPAAVFPGVDLDNYQPAVEFFTANNFQPEAIANSMNRKIDSAVEFELPAKVQFETEIDPIKLQQLLAAAFPGDWADVAMAKYQSNKNELAVIKVDDSYAGFAIWNDGWFGPIGVAEEFRKYGLGKILVQNAINQMHARGIEKIWFNWADEWVVPFYQRLEFEINRTYQRMSWKKN